MRERDKAFYFNEANYHQYTRTDTDAVEFVVSQAGGPHWKREEAAELELAKILPSTSFSTRLSEKAFQFLCNCFDKLSQDAICRTVVLETLE